MKQLRGCHLRAKDGALGHVKDFYFDDQNWTVRYLVADTGHWLPHRKVLLSPAAVTAVLARPNTLDVNLTKKQIEESPSIEKHQPVSRQFESEYLEHFGWPYYWQGPMLWGPVDMPGLYAPAGMVAPPQTEVRPPAPDSHLRSAYEVAGFYGYQIQALDQVFGHISDFILDDQNWAIRYLVAESRNWLPGKHLLLSPQWIAWVSWSEARVYVDFDRQTIRRAPEYHPSVELTREYEQKIFEHYNRQPYWERETEMAKG